MIKEGSHSYYNICADLGKMTIFFTAVAVQHRLLPFLSGLSLFKRRKKYVEHSY